MYSVLKESDLLENLVKRRKLRGLTQKQVEKELGLRSLSIFDYEKGRLKLSVDLAVQLSNLYQCRLEDLLGLQLENSEPEAFAAELVSLAKLGVVGDQQLSFAQSVFKDPVILAEIEAMEFELQRSPLAVVTENLTDKQKRNFQVELFKYINSLIGVDQKITSEELFFRDSLLENSDVEWSEAEKNSINRALTKEYFGKSVNKHIPKKALKHFILWTLFAVALSDKGLHHRESEYIEKVATHLAIKKSDFEFIKRNIMGDER